MSSDKYSLYDPNDVVQAVVCDIGSYATKMGFAGEDFPKSYFGSVMCYVCNPRLLCVCAFIVTTSKNSCQFQSTLKHAKHLINRPTESGSNARPNYKISKLQNLHSPLQRQQQLAVVPLKRFTTIISLAHCCSLKIRTVHGKRPIQ
jgi:hypothetical protein